MKLLISITSCVKDATSGVNQAQRDTWLQDVPKHPGVEYRFFLGDGTPVVEHPEFTHSWATRPREFANKTAVAPQVQYAPKFDEVMLPVPDDYKNHCYKTKASHAWALEQGFTHIFQCFTDTYVDLKKLLKSGFEVHDYVGSYSGNASMGVYAGGGPGYCLSERAARFLVDEPVTCWAEDWWVGTVMRKHGVPLHLDSRFTNYPNMPRHSNDFITSHIANTPVIYDKAKMYEVRSLSTGFDSTDDVVLSVIKDYNWQQVMPYAVSLSRSGFKGTKLMFVQNIGADARENLTRLGFKLIDFTTSDRERLFWTTRYEPALQYLLMNMDRHRYVIWADVRDLVFQSNPSVWLENNLRPHKLVAASECIRIKDEAINTGWVRQTYGEEGLTWLGEHEVCCGGTIAGNADVVYDFLGTVHDALLSTKVPIIDQSVVNYTLRVSPFKDIARIPRMAEGWAVTCSWFLSSEGDFSRFWTDQSPVFDKQTGLVKDPQRGNPFPILHQYDRDWSWKVLIEEKYKEWPAPPSPQHHPQSRPLRKLNRLGR